MQLFSTMVAHAISLIPRTLVQKISRRYIAGDNLADAVTRIRRLNAQGLLVTVDVLGETITTALQAEQTADEYIQVLKTIHEQKLQATISIKPTAFGLLIDSRQCEVHLEALVGTAKEYGIDVCMDMEDIRTHSINRGLCKGIYLEERAHLVEHAWRDRRAINPHFIDHVRRCFETGIFVAIASHDEGLIKQVITMAQNLAVDKKLFEFQMLLGVREPLRDRLLGMGFAVRIYVPYGHDWYGYSTRRMKENPRIAVQVLKSMIYS